jgi:uncharacterized protein YecT (DUF1311 family)
MDWVAALGRSAHGRSLPLACGAMLVLQAPFAAAPQDPIPGSTIRQEQRVAQTAYDTEIAREGRDCLNAQNTYDENVCLKSAVATTQTNFAAFYAALSELLTPDSSNVQVLDESETAWTMYQGKACDAIDHFFRDGTIAPSATMRCVIRLTRSRMRDLNMLYDPPLHH